ncbi:hypothetical protein BDM02DRAFT_3110454 [Thelephora ganbajun]|uniref:Uncharacterized protein n=1 Tax=Thelephora ganbajun TaxID=370292 RepID=A0ACB6ZPS9_THEGA|nr:hypothetical protein BDM02DRAFT_3110454 [Thelephora ganbajun]
MKAVVCTSALLNQNHWCTFATSSACHIYASCITASCICCHHFGLANGWTVFWFITFAVICAYALFVAHPKSHSLVTLHLFLYCTVRFMLLKMSHQHSTSCTIRRLIYKL